MRIAQLMSRQGRILEGIVTTQCADGTLNVSPMGPIVDDDMQRFLFRPFNTSTTYANLKRQGQGVFHVTDDVESIVRAVIDQFEHPPDTFAATRVDGRVLQSACRWYEFRVCSIDDSQERTEIVAETVDVGRIRDFFGFNRAKHAVIEAAILVSRVGILPATEIAEGIDRLTPLVEKTAGDQERRAFELLVEYTNAVRGCETVQQPSRTT